jgi:hypothetical protein
MLAAHVDPELDWLYRLAVAPSDWPARQVWDLTRPHDWYRPGQPEPPWPAAPRVPLPLVGVPRSLGGTGFLTGEVTAFGEQARKVTPGGTWV